MTRKWTDAEILHLIRKERVGVIYGEEIAYLFDWALGPVVRPEPRDLNFDPIEHHRRKRIHRVLKSADKNTPHKPLTRRPETPAS